MAGPIRVKGGQSATSTPGVCFAAAPIAETSASAARLPFIFQLPTISLRRKCTFRVLVSDGGMSAR
jgi:hypothetical protein